MSGKKICLVTGGAGFVGTYLCERLLACGHVVICWDNLFTGRRANISHLMHDRNYTFVEHDVTTYRRVPDATEWIFNLACPASPVHYARDPVQTLKTSVLGALHLLPQAQALGARILQASTSEVYGDPKVHPQPESYWGHVNSMGPRACYDEGKRTAETLFYDFHHSHGVDTRVARIFNTYGPRMAADDGRVISNFIVQALHHVPLTLYGDGQQTRSFCFVDDLVDGLVALMGDNVPAARAINLGNPAEITMAALAAKVLRLTASTGGVKHLPLPQDDPTQRQPNIDAAKALLNWGPKVGLDDGLRRTVAYFHHKLTPAPADAHRAVAHTAASSGAMAR